MIRELKTLIAVAQEGTFAAAGQKVGLTQAAVSAQMQRLEDELGFTLFDRSARAARLNPRGHHVIEQAHELLLLANKLGSRRTISQAPVVVSIGAIASVQRAYLPAALARFHRAIANSQTHIIPGVSLQLLDLVHAGKIDLAVMIKPPFTLPTELQWTSLAREPFVLLVPRSSKTSDWKMFLSEHPFIRYDRASFGGRQVEKFLQDIHLQVKDVCELDELEAIVDLVGRGVGVALLPKTRAMKRWPVHVRAIPLGDHTFFREIGLIHRSNHHLGTPVHALIDFILHACSKR